MTVLQDKNFTESNKNLFLVSTALHLFNAIEAQQHFQTTNNVLVLLFYANGNQDEIQIMKYLQYFPYDKLIIFEPKEEKRYHKLNISLIKEINTYAYDKVFMGYFSANLRRFACNFLYNELFLFDDGTYSIALHNELYNESQSSRLIRKYSEKPKKNKIKHIKFLMYDCYRRLYFKLHGYKNDYKNIQLSFFTIFKLEQCKNEKIINHKFDRIRDIFSKKTFDNMKNSDTKTVYFLGQPLTKVFNIGVDEYVSYIKQIKYLYENKNFKIIYVPHRSEETILFKAVNDLICKTFEVLNLDMPFEIYLLEQANNITNIASFFSSALFSSKKLRSTLVVEAFKPPFDAKQRNDIEAIYDMIKKENIQIYTLKAKI